MSILPIPPLPGDNVGTFVSCSDAIDWAIARSVSPEVAKRSISKKLIGDISYIAGMTREQQFLYERDLINAAGRDLHLDSPHKPIWQHLCTFIQILWPETDIAPSTADAVRIFCWAVGHRRKGVNLIGCQNSSKSATSARLSFACLALDPEYSICTVANPFNNTSDSTIWGDIQDLWAQLCAAWPGPGGKGCRLYPQGRKLATKQVILMDAPKAGQIKVTDIKDSGKLKGTKSRKYRGKFRGHNIVTIDEVNMVAGREFLDVLPNMSSQDTFFLLTSQNYTDANNMGGELVKPSPEFGGPANFEDIDIERGQAWDSQFRTVTLRFDGLKMPNVVAGAVIYDYLLKQSDVDRVAATGGGVNGNSFMSQIRSFPTVVDGAGCVLQESRVKASMCDDEQFSMRPGAKKVAFLDPAFGGRDQPRMTFAEHGPALTFSGTGRPVNRNLLSISERQMTVPVVRGAVWDTVWAKLAARLGVEPTAAAGKEISVEDQLAISACTHCLTRGIPLECFGYDFSMRDNIVTAMNRWSKFKALSFNYNAPPVGGVILPSLGQDTKDAAADRVTELALLAAEVFATKQLRNAVNVAEAIVQLKRTEFRKQTGAKRKIEKKVDYKERFGGVSPDDRDSFIGVVAMAMAKGFRLNSEDVSDPGEPVKSSGRYGLISGLPAFKNPRISNYL